MGQLQRTNVFALICYLISPFFPFPLLSFFSHRPHWMRECHFSCIQMHKRYFFPFIFQIRFDCISFSLSPHFFFSLSPLPVLPCFRYSFFFNLFLFVVSHYFHIYPFLVCPHRRRDRRRHGLLCAVRCVPRRLHRRPRWAADSEVPPNVCGSARAAFVRRQPSTANHTARRSLALRWHRGESREACKPFQRHTCAAVDHFHRPRLRRGRRACRKGVQRASPRGHSPFDKVSFFRFTYTFYLFIFVPSVLLSFPHHSFILSLVHPLSASFFISLHFSSFPFSLSLFPLILPPLPSPYSGRVCPLCGVCGGVPAAWEGVARPLLTASHPPAWGDEGVCSLISFFFFLSLTVHSHLSFTIYLSIHSFI